METLLHRTATFPTPKQRVFSHSNQNKSLFIASGSLSFSARPLFPSLGLRKSVIVEAKRSNKNNNNKKNKQDTHSFVAKPDEAIGPFLKLFCLKRRKRRRMVEFCLSLLMLKKLFEFLNLELQSELKVERLRHYEVVYLIHEKHDEEVGSVNEKVQDFVREKKGRIWRFNDWGMRRLAYKIQKAKNAHYILMNFELEARWINDFKNMLDKDERVIRHLVIKRDEAITEDCPPPPEFQTLQGGMDNHDEEDGVDYDDDDDEAYDEDWEAEAEAVYDDEAEGSVISLHGYKEDDDGNNEQSSPKLLSISMALRSFSLADQDSIATIIASLILLLVPISYSSPFITDGSRDSPIPQSDIDLLEFPLNLEYLEAEFFCMDRWVKDWIILLQI
ncbi:hypothetical protein NC651_020287 [Populus alba x Populus x berolinensis]|nr:hypothetical protein NC651_020287 [Populus alba x Populus x berolinensis]